MCSDGRNMVSVEGPSGSQEIWQVGSSWCFVPWQNTEVVLVLERFMANPAQTRHELRVKRGLLDELAAELFAIVVFLCDCLLQLLPTLTATTAASAASTRFFIIASKLPMELQMMLCRQVMGSTKQNILHQDSEAAFKSLARRLLLPSQS